MNALEQLWQNYIWPKEQQIAPDSDYAKAAAKGSDDLQKFWQELSTEGKRAYDQYCYAQAELETILERDRFLEGFRLGAGVMLELLRPHG